MLRVYEPATSLNGMCNEKTRLSTPHRLNTPVFANILIATRSDGAGDSDVTGGAGEGLPYGRMLKRAVFAILVMFCVRFYLGPPERDHTIVRATEFTSRKFIPVPCSDDYKHELTKFKGRCVKPVIY